MFDASDAKVVIEAMQLDPKKFTLLVVKAPASTSLTDLARCSEIMRNVTRDWPNVHWLVTTDNITVEAFEHDPRHIPHG